MVITNHCLKVDLYWSQKLLTTYLNQSLEGHVWCLELGNALPTVLNQIIYSYTVHNHKRHRKSQGKWNRGGHKIFYDMHEPISTKAFMRIKAGEKIANRILRDDIGFIYRDKFSTKTPQKGIKAIKRPKPDSGPRRLYYLQNPKNYNSWGRARLGSVKT